ncbi:MAG: KpsF/GutQ family sugar-phosphate isomerase [Hyphomicrobiaceae bacterium]|nr:KpsF/GutQ family sugar-phosphate isomerase [Hyphomicrobiaceae bacterium]
MSAATEKSAPIGETVASAYRTIGNEIAGLQLMSEAFAGALGATFAAVVDLMRAARGRVVISGIGKSGHIGSKMAATFASTGTPAFFVHASEASHGDLGMITTDDVVLALSWSGESSELASVIAYTRRFAVPLVAITSSAASTLGRAADHVLELPRAEEACPHGLAPTTSTTMQLALGDALAIALLEARGFTALDFRIYHPGGKLGASLKLIRDVMHGNDRMPLVDIATPMGEALLAMTAKGFGVVGVRDGDGRLIGIVTDGDLRRHLSPDLIYLKVEEVMTANPKTLRPDTLVGTAIDMMNRKGITSIFAVDDDHRPVGFVHMHDLVRIGAV